MHARADEEVHAADIGLGFDRPLEARRQLELRILLLELLGDGVVVFGGEPDRDHVGHQVHLVAALEQGTDQSVGQRLVVGAQAELVGRAFIAAMMQQRGDTQAHGELARVALLALALEGQGEGDVDHLVAIGDVQLLEHIEGLVIAGEDHGALLHRPGRGLGAPIGLERADGLRRQDQRHAATQCHALADQQLDQALGAIDVGKAVALADVEDRVAGGDRPIQAVRVLQQGLLVELDEFVVEAFGGRRVITGAGGADDQELRGDATFAGGFVDQQHVGNAQRANPEVAG